MSRILVVDDEVYIIKTLASILQDEGHLVFPAETGDEAVKFLASNEVDLVILDVWLPDSDGLDLLERIKKIYPDLAIIMISGHGSIDIAVKSTRMGAFDFLEKPPTMERVITSVNNALEQVRLRRENLKLKQESLGEDEMVGKSERIMEIRQVIETAAGTNARVFITGDSGTGKELIARAIYQRSRRLDRPFVKVNCAAIPTELIESELFGHEKGAFTGALNRRIGKFELANRGTIFLDEVCDMSLAAQAKVLRVLQEQQFERVGGNETIDVDVRVIAGTNVDVKKAIEEGKFREDLYYRLNVIHIEAPPLSQRDGDIDLLVEYFLRKTSDEHGTGSKVVDDAGLEFLRNYNWPGNVRELKNIIERLVIMVPGGTITREDIEKHFESGENGGMEVVGGATLKQAREEFEKNYIERTLKKNDRNITLTAKALGVERSNLHRKIKQYGINMENLAE